MRRFLLALLLPALATAEPVERTVDPAKQVVLLVNDKVPDSIAIAKHYAAKRGVPEANICRVSTTDQETIAWKQFRSEIVKPLGRFLEKVPDALYIVPVYGIPLRISEEDPENDAPKEEKETSLTKFVVNRDYASVDSELALLAQPSHDIEGWLDSAVFGKDEPLTQVHGIFLVSRLDGPTPAIAKALVDRAIYAETYGALGKAVVDTRGLDKATPLGGTDEEIRQARAVFEQAGIPLEHEDTALVLDVSALQDCAFYWGWYAADYNGSQAFAFNPGAVAAHLHSGSATSLRTDAKHWVGPLLAHGATCAAGTVYEPLVTGFPAMSVVMDRLLKGYTWGEACAMGNRKLSWMAVFVGDPLYAPFAAGMKEAQEARRKTATEGYGRAASAIDGGDLDGAQAVIDGVLKIGVPMTGSGDVAFLAREIASRRAGKSSGTVEGLVKLLADARAAREKDDVKAAQSSLEKAVGLSSMSFDANLALGWLLVETGRAQAALAPLEKCRKVLPDYKDLREPLGRALAANGRFPDAIPLLQDALLDGAGTDALVALGDCYVKTRQCVKAIEVLSDAVKKDARNRGAFVALARAHEDNKDVPSALATLKEAVRIYPDRLEDITPYKNVWRALQLTAGHTGDKREKEDVEWVIRDFDNLEYQSPTKGVALDIAKQADAATGAESPVSLGTVPAEVMKVPGLPRLVVGNASAAEVTIYIKGACSRLVKMTPLGGGNPVGKDYGVYPGEYEVIVVVKRGADRTVLSTRVTFELNRRYGMVLDNSLAMAFPPPK